MGLARATIRKFSGFKASHEWGFEDLSSRIKLYLEKLSNL